MLGDPMASLRVARLFGCPHRLPSRPDHCAGPILQSEKRVVSILVARADIAITRAACAAGQQVAGPQLHSRHTDVFYVLEGELTFEIGGERRIITVSAGGYVGVPPEVAHSPGSRCTELALSRFLPQGCAVAVCFGIAGQRA